MLSVIIRTHNGENVLLEVLRPLVSAAAEGAVRDVTFFDFGSNDGTATIADVAGAAMVAAPKNKAAQTDVALASANRADWLLMIDQTTVLATGWLAETISFIERQERIKTRKKQMSAVFRPDHEPEAGSADIRRRVQVLLANRLLSTAKLSQGLVARRVDLAGPHAIGIDWNKPDPSIKVPNLLRLRSRSHLAQPMEPPVQEASQPVGQAATESL